MSGQTKTKLFENADVTLPVPDEYDIVWTRICFENGIKKLRFQMKTNTCGQAKTIRIRYRVDANFFENRNKKLRFQMKTDTCGQGLRPIVFKADKLS